MSRIRDDGHVPVMVGRVLALLAPAMAEDGAVLVDGTVGLGGHARAVLAANPRARVVGIDRDTDSLRRATENLASWSARVTLVHAVYDELPAVLARLGLARVNGVLFDLGVSSPQLDSPERGFAYAHDGPLDMRMDQRTPVTAADVVNGYPADDLARVLREYGEERFARRIAAAVVRERSRSSITSSARLADLVREAVPAAARRSGGHPAKRTFQALRIEVNGELDALEGALPAAVAALAVGGRIVVLAYHSLEDRLVKQALVGATRSTTPSGVPVELPGHEPALRLLTRGAERPSDGEVAANPRAASVRLRAAERVRAA